TLELMAPAMHLEPGDKVAIQHVKSRRRRLSGTFSKSPVFIAEGADGGYFLSNFFLANEERASLAGPPLLLCVHEGDDSGNDRQDEIPTPIRDKVRYHRTDKANLARALALATNLASIDLPPIIICGSA